MAKITCFLCGVLICFSVVSSMEEADWKSKITFKYFHMKSEDWNNLENRGYLPKNYTKISNSDLGEHLNEIGLYRIRDNDGNEIYAGQTVDCFKRRLKDHHDNGILEENYFVYLYEVNHNSKLYKGNDEKRLCPYEGAMIKKLNPTENKKDRC